MEKKIKIVLDADVIIHFVKGGLLHLLPGIFPEYDYVVLDYVREELNKATRHQLDMQMSVLKNIRGIEFAPTGDAQSVYVRLKRQFGKGESACMAYCKTHNDVLGSSNLKDIADYCDENGIVYLTTIDFLYYAIRRSVITVDRANDFVRMVREKGSKLPIVDFNTFVSAKTV